MSKVVICVSFVILSLTGSALAAPSKCYSCDSIKSSNCGDPVETSEISICDNPANVSSITNLNIPTQPLLSVSEDEGYTCLKIVFVGLQDNANTTLRDCSTKTIDGKSACEYYKEAFPAILKVAECYTCDSDLCNKD